MDLELLKQLYQQKHSLKQLSIKFNVSVDTIRWQLQKMGVWQPSKKHKIVLDEDQIIRLYTTDHSIETIESILGVSASPIIKVLKKHKLQKPLKFKSLTYSTYKKVIDREYFLSIFNQHVTQRKMAEFIGCGIDMVRALFEFHNITTNSSSESILTQSLQKSKYPLSKETIEWFHFEQNKSISEISKILGIGTTYLRGYCKQNNIQIQGSDIRLSVEFKTLKDAENIKELLQQLVHDNTLTELCKRFKVGKDTFGKLLKKYNVSFPVKYRSTGEQEVLEFIKSILPEQDTILTCDRTIIFPKELDIVIPSKNIAIEYCGLYWHSDAVNPDKLYHVNKLNQCTEQGFTLITIFEDEWIHSKDIVKLKLSQILKCNTAITIDARKCTIREVETSKERNNFLKKFHIQGGDKSQISLGLYFNNQLVSIMTFSKPSHLKGGRNKLNSDQTWELNRFATDTNFRVRGAGGKLLSFFKNNYEWNHIYSYADRRWSTGNLYIQLGFVQTSFSVPNYWYVKSPEIKRHYRYNFKKSNLIHQGFDPNKTEFEIMKERGYVKIWDCGTIRFDMFK